MFESDDEQKLPCADKLAFATREEAQAAATTAMHHYGGRLTVYLCHDCNRWHITTKHEN